MSEQRFYHHRVATAFQFDQQLNGMQRVAAELKEIIVQANLRNAQQFGPEFGKLFFQRSLGRFIAQ
ncbi:hypothetical protein D3C72_1341730 [compost metagenome]